MTTNLAGTLGTFGLDEVLTLLAMGGRSARMEVSTGHGAGEVRMVDGQVSAATSDVSRVGLLRLLVAAAGVSVSDLAVALESDDPVRALVDSGAVDAGMAADVASDYVVDALGEMLTWHEGVFAVEVGAEHPADLGVRMPVADAVSRASSRADEWARVRGELPESERVLTLAPAPGEGVTLDRLDWAVLARIDGRRTLGEVVAASGCAPLVASARIIDLLGRGIIRLQVEESEAADSVTRLLDALDLRSSTAALGSGPRPEIDRRPASDHQESVAVSVESVTVESTVPVELGVVLEVDPDEDGVGEFVVEQVRFADLLDDGASPPLATVEPEVMAPVGESVSSARPVPPAAAAPQPPPVAPAAPVAPATPAPVFALGAEDAGVGAGAAMAFADEVAGSVPKPVEPSAAGGFGQADGPALAAPADAVRGVREPNVEYVAAVESEERVGLADPAEDPDPLAGGLLAQLMAGIRGI